MDTRSRAAAQRVARARAGGRAARRRIDDLGAIPAAGPPDDLADRIPRWRLTIEQLRRGLEPDTEPARAAPPPVTPPPERTGRRMWLFALAIPLVVLAVVVVSCVAIRSDDTHQATPTSPTSPPSSQPVIVTPTTVASNPIGGDQVTAPPTTADTASVEPLSSLTSWSPAIVLPHGGNPARVNELVVHQGALYAVGVAFPDGPRPAVWRSADGETWESVQTTGLDLPESWITHAVSVGGRLVAIGDWRETTQSGSNDYHAIGWTSADGVAWTRIEALPATPSYDGVNGLARVGDEAWLVGFSYDRDDRDITRFEIGADGTLYGPDASDEQLAEADSLIGWGRWGSMPTGSFVLRSSGADVDGWEPVSMAGMEFVRPEAIGATGDGVPVVAGTDADDRIGMWRRGTDGVWARLPGLIPTSATSVTEIAALDDTVVANVSDRSGAVLRPAGNWTTLPDFTVRRVATLDDRIVALGWSQVGETEDYVPHVAESLDGVAWSGIDLPLNQFLAALANFDGRLVAGGSVRDGERAVPAVWIAGSPDGTVTGEPLAPAAWQAPPVPPSEPLADVVRFDGSSWIAELANIDLGEARLLGDLDDLDLDRPTDLTVATDGAVWVATERRGVYRLSGGAWTRFGTEEGLPVAGALELATGPGGAVVAATRVGLAVFDGDRFEAPVLPPDILDPRVIDLLGDGRIVWAATASGLLSWDGTTWRRHAEAEGLPAPAVVGGSLPAGLALRLHPAGTGVVAEFPGVGTATWDGSAWRVLDVPRDARVMSAGWDGSIVYSTEGERARSSDVYRLGTDGSTRQLFDGLVFTNAALAPDGTLFVTQNTGHVFEIRGDSVTKREFLAGVRLGWVGQATAIADMVVLKGGSAIFVYRNGSWSAHNTAAGLDYPIDGMSGTFTTGAIYALAPAPDGTVWALSFQPLPEYD